MSARMRDACGLRYSAHTLSRGNLARSRTSTSTPSRPSAQAVEAPAGPPPTTMTSASRCRATLSNCTRDALEQSHVLPVRSGQPQQRRRPGQIRQDHRSGISREHESRMLRREALESRDGFLEVQLTGKVKGRIEQTAGRGNYTLGDRDAVERR